MAYCKEKGIHCTGYSPLGSTDSPLYKNKTLISVAKEKGKSPQQVLLAWGIQKGWSVLPKSVTEKRIIDNFALDDFELTEADIKKIDSITERFKVCGDDWLPKGVKVFFGDDE